MRIPFSSRRAALITLLSLAAACGGGANVGDDEAALTRIIFPPQPLPVPQQSFQWFDWWSTAYETGDGLWTSDTPVLLGHVNADNKSDFVGFGSNGLWVGLSGNTQFSNLQYSGDIFGSDTGWHTDKHVRLLGDINNDGLDDIVAFGDDGVWTALSNGTTFGPPHYVLADLGYKQGWRVDKHTRLLADVNGDHRKDIVAFGDAGVYVALADGSGGFGPMTFALANFGTAQGWTPARHVRMTTDLNGDGHADIVAIGDAGVWTALSNGSGFAPARYVLASFGANAGWNVDVHRRTLADVDGDGYEDVVGIFNDGVHVALSTHDGGFAAQSLAYADSTLNTQAVVADLNGDHHADILSYSAPVWTRVLGGPFGFGNKAAVLRGEDRLGWWTTGDVDGNGMSDVVFFGSQWLKVARSTNVAPPPAPPAPTSVQAVIGDEGLITISWTDPTANLVTGYEVQVNDWGPYIETNRVFSTQWYGWQPGTQYCFKVRGVNDIATSAWSMPACITAPGSSGGGGDGTLGTLTAWMNEDSPPETGTPLYTYHWAAQGRTITKFRSAYNLDWTVLFLKNGQYNCVPNTSGTIALPPNGTLLPSDIAAISWPATGGSDFHACLIEATYSQQVPSSILFNLDWK